MQNTPTRVTPRMEYEGYAAEDIEPQSTILKVICPELTPNAAVGNVGAGITTGTISLQNRDGTPINVNVTSSNHIVATWGGSSNQRTPPLIRKGEPVKLYKVANQDKFYWEPTGKGRDFRKTDRVQFEVAAIGADKTGGEKNDSNTYSAYLDSENQKVGFKTSQDNGEVAAFSMEADLKKGTFHLSDNKDGVKNRIYMDTGSSSGVPIIQLNLSSGATIKMEGDDVYIKVPKRLLIDAGDRIIVNSPLTIFNINQTGTVLINAANVTINSAKDFVSTAATIGLNGATKIGGVLVAASARIATLVKGSAGSNYTGASVRRPEDTPVSTPSNSPDTSLSGPPYLS
jgi:hypothetical protein